MHSRHSLRSLLRVRQLMQERAEGELQRAIAAVRVCEEELERSKERIRDNRNEFIRTTRDRPQPASLMIAVNEAETGLRRWIDELNTHCIKALELQRRAEQTLFSRRRDTEIAKALWENLERAERKSIERREQQALDDITSLLRRFRSIQEGRNQLL